MTSLSRSAQASLAILDAREHGAVQRDLVRGKWRVIGIGSSEIVDQRKIVARDKYLRQTFGNNTARQDRTRFLSKPHDEKTVTQRIHRLR